jgi:cell division protein FtsZ
MAEKSRKPIKKIKIGIIGAGGGGTNAIANNAYKFAPFDVSFLAINTDIQALEKQRKGNKKDQLKFFERKLIGRRLTRGLGAGSNPDIG